MYYDSVALRVNGTHHCVYSLALRGAVAVVVVVHFNNNIYLRSGLRSF